MNHDEIHEIAKQAAKETVTEMFLALGVNAGDEDAIIAMQKDFAHVRMWRESTDMVRRKGIATAVTVIVTGALGYLAFLFTNHK